MSVPNLVTASRLLLAGLFGVLLFAGAGRWTLLATFALAALTDGLDGLLARRLGQVTPQGATLDQLVDRAFTVAVALLVLVHGSRVETGQNLPLLLALACARELVALPGVLLLLVRKLPLYHVEYVGKVATFVQSVTLGAIVFGASWAPALAFVCAAVGVVSGANYLRYSLRRAAQPRCR